ncbi:MAG: hypothetical protein HRT41_05080 [Campylobacteraceae bacterium]|nr:hypothetical protein [Campylobacteraceae bacterium]
MYKVMVTNQCTCFKNSDLKVSNEFEDESSAIDFAIKIKDKMNDEFCSKHSFEILKFFDILNISFKKSLDKTLKCCGSGCCK